MATAKGSTDFVIQLSGEGLWATPSENSNDPVIGLSLSIDRDSIEDGVSVSSVNTEAPLRTERTVGGDSDGDGTDNENDDSEDG